MSRTELAGLRLTSLTDPAINAHTDSAIRSDAGPEVGPRTVTGADLQPVSNLRRWAQDGESVPASGSDRWVERRVHSMHQLSCGVAAGYPGPGTGRSRPAGKMDSAGSAGLPRL